MKLKTKSNFIVAILTLAMMLGVFVLAVGASQGSYSKVEIIEPSDGNDTDAIQDAFDKVGSEGTVQLIEGDYYTDNIVVEGFCGRFKGAGMGLTRIFVYDEVTPDPINGITALFKFDGGDIQISDLSFNILPDTPYLDNIIRLTGEINSKLTSVQFTGHEGTYTDPDVPSGIFWNVYAAIAITGITEIPDGYTTGEHIITKCEFESVAIGIETFGLVDGELKVGGRYSKGNTFKGGSYGIIMENIVNSKIAISNNYIESLVRSCIRVNQMFVPDFWPTTWPIMSSQWVITHNSLYTFLEADGIILFDFYWVYGSWEPAIEAFISHNHITLDNEMWGGMVIIGVDDAFITDNVITGVGDYGFDFLFCNNLKILGNRVQIDTLGTIGNPDYLFYGMGLYECYNNVIAFNRISHKETDGLFVLCSNDNLITGNLIKYNGGYGLNLVASNDNRITANVLYKNFLGNIFDGGSNIYSWNWEC
ncbi:MAG: NosD domain-containing protein [Promethearchaeota archaeon]